MGSTALVLALVVVGQVLAICLGQLVVRGAHPWLVAITGFMLGVVLTSMVAWAVVA